MLHHIAWYNIFMQKHRWIITGVIVLGVFIAIVVCLNFLTYSSRITLGGKTFKVQVVDTKASLERGLSGRAQLTNEEGMFFVFEKPDNYGFWMKDMLFPIDIIWFDSNFKITYISKSVFPTTYPEIFYPNTPSLYVLEIKAGESDLLNLKIGDSLQFIKKTSK